MHHPIRIGRVAGVIALVLLTAPAAAAASGYRRFFVGPIRVGHGYSVYAFRDGCGSPLPNLFAPLPPPPPAWGEYGIAFVRSIPGGQEVHNYVGRFRDATCDFSTGRFKMKIGKLATIDLRFHARGSSWKGAIAQAPGCGASGSLVKPGTMTGTFKLDIDPAYFGRVHLHRVRGSIETAAPSSSCGHHTVLLGYIGSVGMLTAVASPGGRSSVTIKLGRKVPRIVAGARGVEVADNVDLTGGPALFDLGSALRSATITGPGGPVTGQLNYSAAPQQPGRDGILSGSLRLAFDVGGTKIVRASEINASGGPQLFTG